MDAMAFPVDDASNSDFTRERDILNDDLHAASFVSRAASPAVKYALRSCCYIGAYCSRTQPIEIILTPPFILKAKAYGDARGFTAARIVSFQRITSWRRCAPTF